jgi:sarcosine oxidase gamma subunit
LRAALAAMALAGATAAAAQAPGGRTVTVRPSDLAAQVEATYSGSVISDARGSSRSDVRITVTRIGPNKVRVVSDYPRLPSFESALSRYMATIQNAGGDQVFLFDTAKRPPSLDITVDDASWSGTKD